MVIEEEIDYWGKKYQPPTVHLTINCAMLGRCVLMARLRTTPPAGLLKLP